MIQLELADNAEEQSVLRYTTVGLKLYWVHDWVLVGSRLINPQSKLTFSVLFFKILCATRFRSVLLRHNISGSSCGSASSGGVGGFCGLAPLFPKTKLSCRSGTSRFSGEDIAEVMLRCLEILVQGVEVSVCVFPPCV